MNVFSGNIEVVSEGFTAYSRKFFLRSITHLDILNNAAILLTSATVSELAAAFSRIQAVPVAFT